MVFNRKCLLLYPSTTMSKSETLKVDCMLVTNTLPADFSPKKSLLIYCALCSS